MPEKPERTSIAYLVLCTIAALVAIVWGALFLIAPVWQFSGAMPFYASQTGVPAISNSDQPADFEANQEASVPNP